MSGSKRMRTHADAFADLNDRMPADLDPEDDPSLLDSDQSDSDGEPSHHASGKEHYEDVGQSKLRREREPAALGPSYQGARVSRAHGLAVDDELEHDPFGDYASSSVDDQEPIDDHDVEDEADDGRDSMDQDTDATSASDDGQARQDDGSRAELRRLMEHENKAVAASVSEATRLDAEKGRGVLQQRKAFDTLLNTRVKLQQALIAVNTLPILETPSGEADFPALETTEAALARLWNSMEELRSCLSGSPSGTKRRHSQSASDESSVQLWKHMSRSEEAAKPTRRNTLRKWSRKSRANTAAESSHGRLNPGANPNDSIVDVLDDQLANPERMVKRTHVPRSSAPAQAQKRETESRDVFDDADFYGLLLKELLEQRSADAGVQAQPSVYSQHWKAAREARVHRKVDTKASKGRKMRFTVHEKLQNFMVPEDRGSWGERQVDELFGSLFGQKMAINGSTAADRGYSEDTSKEETALHLFRA